MTILKIYKFAKVFFQKLQEDHVTAYSAMSAYFLLMSFVPFLMILLMLAKYLPFSANDVLNLLNTSVLVQENAFLQEIFKEIFNQNSGTVLSITFLLLLWTSSKSIWGFMKGLNSIYDIQPEKGNLLLRFRSVLYTIVFLFLISILLVLVVFGNSLLFLILFFLLLYVHVPTRKTRIRAQLFGAVFTALGWILYSFFFSVYIRHFSGYTRLYGCLGTILIFFLWLYMLMYFVFLGAEINYFLSPKGRIYYISHL